MTAIGIWTTWAAHERTLTSTPLRRWGARSAGAHLGHVTRKRGALVAFEVEGVHEQHSGQVLDEARHRDQDGHH